ncbi:MAG: hypothetical protein U0792_13895 [Gemmataceae bacterium]
MLRRTAQNNSLADIDAWFVDRTGAPLSPAGRLFLLGPQGSQPTAERLLVVRFPSVELTDGQCSGRNTCADRGAPRPTTVVVNTENLESLRKVLAEVGVNLALNG